MSIRSLGPSDVHELARFLRPSMPMKRPLLSFTPHPFNSETAQRICDRDGINSDRYFAAFDGTMVVGYAMLRGWDEGYDMPSFGVCVRPDARGRGIGRRLLADALGRARAAGACRVMLKVFGENSVARNLYESMGFVFDGPASPGIQAVGIAVLDPAAAASGNRNTSQ